MNEQVVSTLRETRKFLSDTRDDLYEHEKKYDDLLPYPQRNDLVHLSGEIRLVMNRIDRVLMEMACREKSK